MKKNKITIKITLSDSIRKDFHQQEIEVELPYDESRMVAKDTVRTFVDSMKAVMDGYDDSWSSQNPANIP